MRLYLSSFDLGNCPEELVALARGAKEAVVVVNALDNLPEARMKWLNAQTEKLRDLGFTARELDLRDFFGKPSELEESLRGIDVVWINGGNAFILRRAMKQSGFDKQIRAALGRDEIVYAGFSAAAVIVGDSLAGLDIVDRATAVPAGYDPEVVWEGLGLLPYVIAVHFRSDHAESSDVDREIAFFQENRIPYRPLRDGEVLIIDGEEERLLGL
ncbi:Type 1 glutamine amidotransferase-like domain-containing protein [Methylosinus sp. PW1]|uniref:Type 1 glutamine amidotransferase-like domain-containing protein n=1 Tax=Methylosinus sp. PW1 TaxID=107636 RepID=UPI000563F8CE|nr:Type 1 glutamine amidotransferase-like domain-containing protein [Methylosinus sp. PW1]